ncbi:MAG: right-handed parallel beta-helix repeat-containing protein, partial [Anaerolineae bacterium]
PFVHVIEVDPAGTVSSGATADPPGTVKNYNVVSYRRDDMLETGSYDFDGIGFWDRLAATDTPTPSNTPTATDTSTPTSTPTDTPTPTPTETPAPTDTHTPPATPSATPTSTSGPTDTPTPTPTATLPADCEELLINGDFETGSLSPWTSFGDIGLGPGYSSAYGAQLGGVDEAGGELYQWATFPEGADPVQLSFWWRVDGAFEDPGDFVVVLMQYDEEVDEVLKMRAEAPLGEWRQEMVDLTPYVGQTVLVTFLVNTNQEDTTTFRLDDVSLLACGRATPTPTHTPTTTPTEEPPREWVVNTTLDHDDGQCSPLDVGDCTLREAINAANQAGEPNSIRFDISEDDAGFEEGRWTIRPHSPLPDLTDDGIEMGACAEQPLIVLDGALASRGSSGLALRGAGQAVRGLVLTRWSGSGVHISSAAAHNNTVACNEIMDNWGHGVLIDEAAHHNAIGGELGGNWIAGNGGDGVHIGGAGTDANQVTGNVIGADRAATAAWPNVGHGVRIADSAQFNALGGEEPDERNIIAGNAHSGVMVEGEDTDFNTITNNLIGIGADGQTRLPNGNHGVGLYSGVAHNEVGTSASAPNVIGANGWSGVAIVRSASNTVMGNQIGLDSAAGEDLGNAAYGVHVVASSDNELVANSVARNGSDGVRVEGEAALHNRISLNAITDNGGEGIRLLSGGNGDLLPPAIITVTRTSVSGTACPGCTVEVFSDPADEGAYVHSPPYATADSSGAWTWYGSVTGANVTATATDADGNTSPFASDGLLFSGQIMLAEGSAAQRTGVTPIPIPKPVQVVLYGSYDPAELGEPLLSVPTGRDGSFVMSCVGSGCLRPLPFFNLVVDDPGFVVQRAESRSGGRVTDQGWIQFEMGGVAARADSDVRYAGPFPDNDFWVEAVTEADPDVILEPVDTVPRMPPVGAAEEVDFQIAGIEVTQAIQCYSDKDSGTITTGCANDNDLPLVAGKPAVVRVDVSAGICSPPEGRGPVRVDLGVQSATAVYTTQTHFKAACATSAERRQHVDATANFYLQKPEAGTVSVWAE